MLRPVRRLAPLLLVVGLAPGAHAASGAAKTAKTAKTVKIEDFEYHPKRVTIKAGQRVRWVNRDFANHSVTFSESKLLSSLSQDSSGTLRFSKPGRYRYICDFHPSMRGVVVVRR